MHTHKERGVICVLIDVDVNVVTRARTARVGRHRRRGLEIVVG
jgi:hypothetical protein